MALKHTVMASLLITNVMRLLDAEEKEACSIIRELHNQNQEQKLTNTHNSNNYTIIVDEYVI